MFGRLLQQRKPLLVPRRLLSTFDATVPYKIVLTGGPCAGKTTALSRIKTFLTDHKISFWSVPEAATLLFLNGATFDPNGTEDTHVAFQKELMRLQMHLEDVFMNLASQSGNASVVVCDRGLLDSKAYVEDRTWKRILRELDVEEADLRDNRYDAVFHMVTAANGAEAFYTLENNAARSESVEEACAIDSALQRAWTGHSNLRVISNSTTAFEEKIQRVLRNLALLIGLPTSQGAYKRYKLVKDPIPPAGSQVFHVEKVYLLSTGNAGDGNAHGSYVRKRQQGAVLSCTYTSVEYIRGQRIEKKKLITPREYQAADPHRDAVHMKRIVFLWNGVTCHVDTYLTPHPGLSILKYQVEEADPAIDIASLPPGIEVEQDASEDQSFFSYDVSARKE